jgi:ER membrane protein complex subunit 3
MVLMQGIQHFFSGYVLLKVPFPLTAGFKNMFQRGMAELPDLDSSYVSSVSWYFLVMFGLRSFFQLAVGDPPLEYKEQMQLQAMQGYQPPSPPGKPQNGEAMAKLLRQEAENLEMLVPHTSELDSVEKRLLGNRMPRKKQARSGSSADFLFATVKPKKKTQ